MPGPTQLLSSLERGENHAAEELLPLVYDELRRLAAWHLANERPGQTLDATAFVHEAWLRLWSDLLNLIPPCRNCEALFFAGPTQPEKQKWFHQQSELRARQVQKAKVKGFPRDTICLH